MIDEATPKHIPINGRFKLQASNGYESFLAFQGAPWPIRKAIMLDTGAIAIIETTDHMVKFRQLGIIRQRFELEFDVEPVEHVMRIARRKFLDSAEKIENGFRIIRIDLSSGTRTVIDRTINNNDTLTVTYYAVKRDGNSMSAKQIYLMVEDNPNEKNGDDLDEDSYNGASETEEVSTLN